jgi:hypothetical protein
MLKVLAPILLKLLFMLIFIPSMAVKIPTNAIIPIEMINAVIIARVLLALMEVKAIDMFSANVMMGAFCSYAK